MGRRRTFTGEFKRQAVRIVVEQGLSVAEVATDLDVHANVLRKWKNQFEAEGENALPGLGKPTDFR